VQREDAREHRDKRLRQQLRKHALLSTMAENQRAETGRRAAGRNRWGKEEKKRMLTRRKLAKRWSSGKTDSMKRRKETRR
jgi:hypothetical protein